MTARAPIPPPQHPPRSLRIVDLLAGLSLVTDAAMGHEPEEALRTCMAATLLARRIGLREDETRTVFYTALLQHVGCTGPSHETAAFLGDDIRVNAVGSATNLARPSELLRTFIPGIAGDRGRLGRLRLLLALFTVGNRYGREIDRAVCDVGRATARRLGLPGEVQDAVYQSVEAWNGAGGPQGLRGEAIALPTRIVRVASIATLVHRAGGTDAAVDVVRDQSDSALDPGLAHAFVGVAAEILDEVAAADPRTAVAELEPRPVVRVPEADVARVARIFGELVDLKAPFLHGHAAGVAALARSAGQRMGLDAASLGDLETAAHLHDLGRAAVPTTIWEKPGPLTAAEWERVRLHPYHTERILVATPALTGLANLAGAHHERLDGSGYHRGSRADALSPAACVMAAADAFAALTAERPHRPALPPERAAATLRDEVAAGRLDADACAAVLGAAGASVAPVRRDWPDGLTEREVEVLRNLAGGASNRELGRRLGISSRTAEHHVQSIYAKIGSSSRAAAALYAMEHGLLAGAGHRATDR